MKCVDRPSSPSSPIPSSSHHPIPAWLSQRQPWPGFAEGREHRPSPPEGPPLSREEEELLEEGLLAQREAQLLHTYLDDPRGLHQALADAPLEVPALGCLEGGRGQDWECDT